jgi:hypothetical protein
MRRDCRLLLGKTRWWIAGTGFDQVDRRNGRGSNHHGSDLRVWVMATDGSSYRLGIVPKLGAVTLELPSMTRPPAEVRFVTVPFGTDDPPMSEPIIANFVMRLIYTVAHEPSSSTLGKRP